MDVCHLITTLSGTVLSGLVATIITLIITSRRDNRKMKRELAADLFSFRYQIANNRSIKDSENKSFAAALNRVPIVFCDSKDVLLAYDKLYNAIYYKGDISGTSIDDILVMFLKEICKSSDIKIDDWDENRIKGTFNI